MSNAITTQATPGTALMQASDTSHALQQLTTAQVIERIDAVKTIMANVMVKDVHYGVIPGCGSKPTLLKPGAEMLAMTFRIAPEVSDLKISELGNGDREYTVTCALRHIEKGLVWASGVGSCATTESKYVKRACKADLYNTCLKMAKKRAQIDATLTALNCSHLFTQDLEDYKEDFAKAQPAEVVEQPKSKAAQPANEAKPNFAVNIDGQGQVTQPAKAAVTMPKAVQNALYNELVLHLGKIDVAKTESVVKDFCRGLSEIYSLSRQQVWQMMERMAFAFPGVEVPNVWPADDEEVFA